MSYRILVLEELAETALAILRAERWVIDRSGPLPPAELAQVLPPYDALILRGGSRITAEVLAAAENLRVIGRPGVGVDHIDVDAATRRGIVVMNTPGANTVATAELALGLLITLARHITRADRAIKEGRFDRKSFFGTELFGKRLGIIGFGRVGSTFARYCRGLGMEVTANDPFVPPDKGASIGVRLVSLDDVLTGSDYLSLHPTLTPLTRRMIDRRTLAQLKPGARLLNTARGEIVDEEALLEALDSGRLAAAALDVHASEPPRDWRLAQHPRVVSTPHLGGVTLEAEERVGTAIATQVRDYLKDGTIRDAVNAPTSAMPS